MSEKELIKYKTLVQENEKLKYRIRQLEDKSEINLLDDSQKFQAVFENAGDGILVGNNKGEIVDFNESFGKLTGHTKNTLLNKHISILFPKDILNQKPLNFSALDHGQSIIIERSILDTNGNAILIEMHSKRLNEDYYISIIRDLTERENQRKRIQESQERYKMLSDLSIEGILIHDKGIVVDVNIAIIKMFGYTREEIIGNDAIELLAAENSRPILYKNLEHISDTPFDSVAIRKNGQPFPIELEGRDITINDKKLRVVSIRDISFHKKVEAIYALSLNLNKLILNQTENDIIEWCLNEAIRISESEACFVAFTDEKNKNIEKACWCDEHNNDLIHSHNDESFSASCLSNSLLNSQQMVNGTLFFENKTICTPKSFNQPVKQNLIIPVFEHKKIKMFFGFINKPSNYYETDANILNILSESLWTALVRLRLQDNLKTANAAKDKFFSIIAHDLKTPIGSISALSELLYVNKGRYDEDTLNKYISLLHKSSSSTLSLLDNLLQWAQSQTNTIEYFPQPVFFSEILNPCFDVLAQAISNKSITVEKNIENNLELFVDKNLVTTCLLNLISNAIKYTPNSGKIVINISINDENYAQVCVKDNGIGINSTDIEKLFDITQDFKRPGTEKEQGTGLGLVLCQEFIALNKGEIWVKSEVNIGSEFYFTIPLNRNN